MSNRLSFAAVAKLVGQNNHSGQTDQVIIAQIYKESRFDPYARSSAPNSTAAGLMQITKTAVLEVNRVRHAQYQHGAMTIASTNIEVGSLYLSICIGRAGSLLAGLDYYGTGPGYGAPIVRAASKLAGARDPMAVLKSEIGE